MDTLTNLERAATSCTFSSYRSVAKSPAELTAIKGTRPFRRYQAARKPPEIHERLADVTIECLAYADVIRRYDPAEALFYLDPPY
jgi:DNA adenine methylase